jgi:predicted permease
MLAIFNIVFPVFALIFLGFLCRKRDILSVNAASELNRFVIYLGLPALLFDSIARLTPADFSNLRFIAVFAIGIVTVFLLTAWIKWRQGAVAGDIIIDSLSASYANVGFLGIPLCLLSFGHDSMPPAVIAMIMTACLLFAGAIVLLEICLHADKHIGRSLLNTGNSLIRNPILIAPILGGLVAASGYVLPSGVQQLFKLLGAAASPCALVSLGLFLAQPVRRNHANSSDSNHTNSSLAMLVGFKLLLHPAITALFAYWILPLPKLWADTALLLAATPIGTGPFMLAELYQREAALMSRAILISTCLSLLSIALILAWIAH